MSDRRQTKRIPAQFRVWCETDEFTMLAQTVNVSRDGMFVRTSRPPPRGERLRVSIEDLGTVASVEVRWCRSSAPPGRGGAGLKIVGFERGGVAWERYVDQNGARSGEHRITWPPEEEDT